MKGIIAVAGLLLITEQDSENLRIYSRNMTLFTKSLIYQLCSIRSCQYGIARSFDDYFPWLHWEMYRLWLECRDKINIF